MGRDKTVLAVGGRPMASRVADALRAAGAVPVVAVGGDLAAHARHGLLGVPDDHPGEGPLGGVVTALRLARSWEVAAVVVLAGDLPSPDRRAVSVVVETLAAQAQHLAAVPVVDGGVEPLHAAWRTAAFEPVARAFAAGERSPRRLLDRLGAAPVLVPAKEALTGVNTPAELAAARDRSVGGPAGQTGGMTDNAVPSEISVAELAERAEGAWILDVRQPEEYREGHVPGAVLIPLDQLGDRHTEVPRDTDVYVICKSGGRSAAAVEALAGAGYRVTNVAGGTMAWIESGRPVVSGDEPR